MQPPEKKKYSTNYLSQVICQVTFDKDISISDESLKIFKESLGEEYGELSLVKQQGIIIENDGSQFKSHAEDTNLWQIQSADRTHIISITLESFAITHTEYSRFSDYVITLEKSLNLFFDKFNQGGHLNRIGLRFINQVRPKSLTKGWAEYIDEKLTAALDFVDSSKVRRSMHVLNLQHDENTKINFNYGIFNQYFPSPIVQNEFILDIDAYTDEPEEVSECMSLIAEFNKTIAIYFEMSITDKLREEMGVIDGTEQEN